jgi:ABC-type Zn uptake system ZnuABC Zn-binding protein ZnuA
VIGGVRARALLGAVLLIACVGAATALGGCGSGSSTDGGEVIEGPLVVGATGYLADITANVAGPRVRVEALIPGGGDPHSFQPTPGDVSRLAECRMVVLDVPGLSPLIDEMIESTESPDRVVVVASAGLADRATDGGDDGHQDGDSGGDPGGGDVHHHGGGDPHYWLDPVNVMAYVDNIRDGLIAIDPEGATFYRQKAEEYRATLSGLDAWIRDQVSTIPEERRLLVTNHESFGYFADRYGFITVGTVFPTVAAAGAPSARHLAGLIEAIRSAGAPAIFLETGSNSDLADQVARETGAVVVEDLYTHSLGEGAASYVDMMRWNVERIVEALR